MDSAAEMHEAAHGLVVSHPGILGGQPEILRCQQNRNGRRPAILELWTHHRPTLERHLDVMRNAVEIVQPGDHLVQEEP